MYCLHGWLCIPQAPSAHSSQKRALYSLGLELETVVSHLMWQELNLHPLQEQWPCRLSSTSCLTEQFLPIFAGFISSGHVYMYSLGVLKRYMLLSDLTRNSNKTRNQGAFPLGTHPSLSGIWKYTSTPRHVQPVGEVHDTNYTNGWDFRTENVCWDFLTFSEGWRTSAWTVEAHSKRSTHSTGTLWAPFPQMPCRAVGLQGTLIHYWHTGIAHEF